MNTSPVLLTLALIVALPFATAQVTPAAPVPPAPATAPAEVAPSPAAPKQQPAAQPKAKPAGVPFNGKIASVDRTAGTLTLAGKTQRVVNVTADTRLTRDGQPAVLADAKVGEPVGGYAKKNGAGQLEAISIRLGPKPAAEAAPKPSKGKTKTPPAGTE
jgi:hypothetical protein